MNIDLLHRVADGIKTGWELCDSRWRKSEAEYIACECIRSCQLNQENHGDAFSWYGTGLKKTSGGGLVNNPEGLQLLINDNCIVAEDYLGNLQAPDDTVLLFGEPQVLRVTDRLLQYAAGMCNIPVNGVDASRAKVAKP